MGAGCQRPPGWSLRLTGQAVPLQEIARWPRRASVGRSRLLRLRAIHAHRAAPRGLGTRACIAPAKPRRRALAPSARLWVVRHEQPDGARRIPASLAVTNPLSPVAQGREGEKRSTLARGQPVGEGVGARRWPGPRRECQASWMAAACSACTRVHRRPPAQVLRTTDERAHRPGAAADRDHQRFQVGALAQHLQGQRARPRQHEGLVGGGTMVSLRSATRRSATVTASS